MLPNSFYEMIMPIPKPARAPQKKEITGQYY